MADLQTHHPNELLIKEEGYHPRFQPGHMVSHGTDQQSLGMVVARRESEGTVECDVLWSRVPTAAPKVILPPRRPSPVPARATWTRTMRHEATRLDDAYSPRSFWAPGRVEETFDGEELFEPGSLSPEEARSMCSRPRVADLTVDQDGYISITRRDVPRHELPEYVGSDPPNYRSRYEQGCQLKPW